MSALLVMAKTSALYVEAPRKYNAMIAVEVVTWIVLYAMKDILPNHGIVDVSVARGMGTFT